MKTTLFIRLAAFICALAGSTVLAQATNPPATGQIPTSITVFLDCTTFYCDEDFLRTEIKYVNWVRDRSAADVHVLGTAQATGGGGREYTIAFLGLRQFAGVGDTLRYSAGSTETDDERRNALAKVLQTGLVRYIAHTTLASRLQISMTPATGKENESSAQTQHDPWNFWTYRTSFNGNFSGDANNKFKFINASVEAKRVTEQWKLDFTVRENYSQSDFTIDDTTSTFIRRNYNFEQLAVRSLGPRVAAGWRSSVGSSTYDNKKFSYRLTPAVEYDIFPYSESTRRMLTLRYAVGYEGFKYQEITIYGKLHEGHPLHSLSANLAQNQPWGSMDIGLEGGQYLDMTNRNYAQLFGNLSVRLFKGFNVNLGGDYEAIRNQLYLAAVGATNEQILTQQRQLATNYQYFLFVGINYTFGSVLNNIVNPRFGRD